MSPPRAQPPPGAAVVGGPGPAGKGEILAPSRGLPPPVWPQGTRLGEKRAFLGFAQQRSPAAFPAAAGGSPGLSLPLPLPAPPGSTGSPPATPGASAEPPGSEHHVLAASGPWDNVGLVQTPRGGGSSPSPAPAAKLPICPGEIETPGTAESSNGGKIPFSRHTSCRDALSPACQGTQQAPDLTEIVGRLSD